MKKPVFILLSFLCFHHCFSQRISIQPSILDFNLSPSITQSQSISITNLSNDKVVFQPYLGDWLRDSVGGHQYFKPDTLNISCASWVKFSKNIIEIEPGKTEELIVQMQAPVKAQQFNQMKWAMLFLQNVDEQNGKEKKEKQMQTQIKEILRVGIHIYQTPPNLNKYAAKALSFKPLENEKNSFEFVMKNVGDVMLNCKSYIQLTNIIDGTEYKLDKVEYPVFPDGVRKIKFTIPDKIPVGKYSALAILDIGEDLPLEAIEKVIEIK